MTTRVLIVEDHADSAEFLRLLLEPEGYVVKTAATAQHTREEVAAWKPDIILMDLMLPDVEGLDLLRELRTMSPESQVIVVSGHGSITVAVEAMENGALSFIEKPLNPSVLMAQLHKAAEKLALTAENRRLRAELDESTTYGGLIGRSKPMRQLYQLIKSVAPTDANVLITGENGSGKEVVATAIHESSKRAKGPFIKVNCAAIPTELIESELFGHKRGAFTGAVNDKQGLMELANNGTLLLDEIGDLTPNLQVKLLRVLQDREFRPGRQHEGAEDELPPDFRDQRQRRSGAEGRAAARGSVLPHQHAHAAGARPSREADRYSADGRVFPPEVRRAAREVHHVLRRGCAARPRRTSPGRATSANCSTSSSAR